MRTSEQINELATALNKAQAELEAAPMNATNPFLKNSYADLGSIIETVRPALAAHGLSFVQMVGAETMFEDRAHKESLVLNTRLMHTSGQWLEETMPLNVPESERGKSAMQVMGSVITYARRYALAAMLGVHAEQDTDGNAPRNGQQRRKVSKPAPKPPAPSANSTPVTPEPEPAGPVWNVESEQAGNTTADMHAWLDDKARPTDVNGKVIALGLVADALVMTGKYNDRQHVKNALNLDDAPVPDGFEIDYRKNVTLEGALKVYDWAMARKEAE